MGTRVFRVGERFAGYEIVGLLGAGGFAEVYEVIAPDGERRALKTLATDVGSAPKLRARLGQEGAVLSMIEHPNVVRLYEAGFHGDRMFLVLELVRGRTLRDALLAMVDPAELLGWILEACEGVIAAHEVGVLHRDLKPENMLIGVDGHLKVIDFGIAKLSHLGLKTTADQKMGTALYMAPEVLRQAPPDARSDVYAMGLLLYEALSGSHPMVGESANLASVCERQLGHHPPLLSTVVPGLSDALADVIDRAIQKDPARRLPTMRALAEALRAAAPRSSFDRTTVRRGLVVDALSDAITPVLGLPAVPRGVGGTQPLPPSVVRQARAHAAPPAAPRESSTAPIAPAIVPFGVLPATNTTGGRIAVVPPPPPGPTREPSEAAPATRSGAPWRRALVVAVALILGLSGGAWLAARLVTMGVR